jgi:hypothetical protein
MREVLNGRVWTERPVTVLHDDGTHLATHLAAGTVTRVPAGVDHGEPGLRLRRKGTWKMKDVVFRPPDVVRLARMGDPFEVFVMRTATGQLATWYVNFQEPLRRVADGFETLDNLLDLEVSADRTSWRRKDVDELARAVQLGVYDEESAASFFSQCERVERILAAGQCPWDTRWAAWEPGRGTPAP